MTVLSEKHHVIRNRWSYRGFPDLCSVNKEVTVLLILFFLLCPAPSSCRLLYLLHRIVTKGIVIALLFRSNS